MKTQEKKIDGLTLKDWVKRLMGKERDDVNKALNYLDNNIEKEMISLLNSSGSGRVDWKNRGFIVRYRNLVKPIVEKSGMLFKDHLPKFELFGSASENVDVSSTNTLHNIIQKMDFESELNNIDILTRLLKTVIVLVQYDKTEEKFVQIILHRGNCNVLVSPENPKKITGLIYEVSQDTYRIITETLIVDFIVEENGTRYLITYEGENPFGIIPAVQFYDTSTPIAGFWGQPGMDLVNTNEQYNLHLIDSEFALSWAKKPTLYTNCIIRKNNSNEISTKNREEFGITSKSSNAELIGGPDKVIVVDSHGIDAPFIEYKAPKIDIKNIDAVQNNWVRNVAQDWSVRLEMAGEARANSGFQLIVEEIPNSELRKMRMKMFETGFSRWYKIISRINNYLNLQKLPEDSELVVDFGEYKIPTDKKTNEEIWSLKIAEDRATRVDYFMEEFGMTKDQAIEKIKDIEKYRQKSDKVVINNNARLPDGNVAGNVNTAL